tara:strand:+ start:734 stop:1126 length:393 start_codon:yes stop_codon:yes gene_type:complete
MGNIEIGNKLMKKTIDITPTWEASAMIYAMVLQNPDASPESLKDATLDLVRLAEWIDVAEDTSPAQKQFVMASIDVLMDPHASARRKSSVEWLLADLGRRLDERQRALLSCPEVKHAEDIQKVITAKEDL